MKNILFMIIGFVCGISICAYDGWQTVEDDRIAEERDYYINKSDVAQMVIWELASYGEKYPEFVNNIVDVYSETDLADAAWNLGITIWKDDVDMLNYEDSDVELRAFYEQYNTLTTQRNILSDIIRNKIDCENAGDKTSMETLVKHYIGDTKQLSKWVYSY